MRPTDLIPSNVRDRLDAAREHLHVTIEWIERGDARCCGRDFGFWCVMTGPDGWQHRPKREHRYGEPSPIEERGPCTAEWTDLAATIKSALDLAEKR